MAFTIVVKAEAHQDAIDAYNYYEQIQPGLGEMFLESLQERYTDLSTQPTHYSPIAEDTLKALRDVWLKRFP